MSLVVMVFATLFILCQGYALLFTPSYNQTQSVDFLSRKNNEVYTVPTRAFLPTFLIYAIDLEGTIQYMPEFVDYQWTVDSQLARKVSTINCKDLVDSWT